MDTNYFVCTLGQAARLRKDENDFRTIPEFLRRQTRRVPDKPAAGFYRPCADTESPWSHHVLTFRDVEAGTEEVAKRLREHNGKYPSEAGCVALLCPSSANFLFVWLALIRLGHSVLLIAPQCQAQAIAHLCMTCKVTRLYYDDCYGGLARDAVEAGEGAGTQLVSIPEVVGKDIFGTIQEHTEGELPHTEIDENDIAYLHHTSGTSTGVPKPIPQTHRAAVGVPPCLDGSSKATFTTTPLFHGGIADLFRAWTSDALIWLFPGKEVPITASNIVRCLDNAKQSSEERKTPPIKYFSSVPYVLQMLSTDDKGLDHLKAMDIVGVGGAALPGEAGGELVRKGINLVSRFGSAECGFLMSSHREYNRDKEWQYLRSSHGAEVLSFEEQVDGTSELVVKPGWPHMAKRNRKDGSYATADLFAPHPTIPDAWKYHSRADSQVTLITGKKFDPAPLESAIAASPLLNDVLIFGNGQPFPGALLFRSPKSQRMSDDDLIRALAPHIERLNSGSQSHARIPRNMLVPLPYTETPLEKSSKGTVLRGAAESRYKPSIENAYANLDAIGDADVPDDEVANTILQNIKAIVRNNNDELRLDSDLFSYGVDSVACVQIRHTLRQLLPTGKKDTPINIVEDCGTVKKLADYVVERRHGRDQGPPENEEELMQKLVEEYSEFRSIISERRNEQILTNGEVGSNPKEDVVVLTGATGALGAHILSQYLALPTCTRIYCLVRGVDKASASERVLKSLKQRGLDASSLSPSSSPTCSSSTAKVRVLPSKLSDPHLGLRDEDYAEVAKEATLIVHCAWAVNFRVRLRSFVKDHIAGVRNLINLALASQSSSDTHSKPPRFLFCSSVASVSSLLSTPIPEIIISSPSSSSPLGYSRSKWVAEQICYRAHCNTVLRGRIAVLRVGQLSGDTKKGVWNKTEAWPLMLSTVKVVGCLPDLKGEEVGWLAVDLAAGAVIQIGETLDSTSDEAWTYRNEVCDGESEYDGMEGETEKETEIVVCNIVNQAEPVTRWTDLLHWLERMGEKFETVEPREWVRRLEEVEGEHPAKKLLGMWKERYGGVCGAGTDGHGIMRHGRGESVDGGNLKNGQDGERYRDGVDERSSEQEYDESTEGKWMVKLEVNEGGERRYMTSRAERMAPLLKDVRPLDEEYFGKIWAWLKESVFEGLERG